MSVRKSRWMILALSLLAVVLSVIWEGNLVTLLLSSACLLGAVLILYRHIGELSGISQDNPKIKTLRLVTVFDVLILLLCVGAARLAEAGIACECLVRLEHQDYERMVTGIPVKEAAPPAQGPLPDLRTLYTAEPLPDPRRGVAVGCYTDCCRAAAEELLSRLREELPDQGALLVLGTEECMYPALTVGSLAEQTGLCATVRCHATTRSPIGICPDSAYPIRNGVLLPSFYGGDRKTYLYDLAAYDAALVVTDAPAAVDGTACTRLAAALGQLGCPRLYLCRI